MKRQGPITCFITAWAVILAAFPALLAVTGCGAQPETGDMATAAITTENPYPVPGTAASGTVSTPAVTTVQQPAPNALDMIIRAYDVDSHLGQISELASDRYQGRRTGSAGAQAAADYIAARFEELGLIPWAQISPGSYLDSFTAAGLESDNVIGVLPGSGPGGEYLILGAHYDHLGVDLSGQVFNGADDNAAGVGALIEFARILKQLGLTPKKTLVFCAFSGEEEGEYGAEALGYQITAAGLAGSVEMINIDGIGATGGSYFGVWDEGAANAAGLVATLEAAGSYLGVPVREEGTDIGSDAQAFDWQYGIPAVTVDWNWGDDPGDFHPYYHTVYDDVSAIDPVALTQASRVAFTATWMRASQ